MRRLELNPEWSEEARYVYEHDRVEWWDPVPMPHRYNSYHSYIDMLLGLVSGLEARTVLNVGCAQATLDLLLAERGVKVVAVEIREGFLEYARSRFERGYVEWLQGDFLKLQLEGRQFDLVMSHHAIEHVTKPDEFLSRMANCVRPGGHLLITTPNQKYFRAGLPSFSEAGDLSRYPGFENSCDGHEHIFAFTPWELCSLGLGVGLNVERHFYYESFFLAGHMMSRYAHRVLPKNLVRLAEPLSSVPYLNGRLFCNQGVVFTKPAA